MTFVPSNEEMYFLVPRPEVDKTFGIFTPFRGFLDALDDKINHKETRTNHGAVMWRGYPVGLLIGFGLMPVLQRLAQKHEQSFITLADQSRLMAVADPLIQAGLVLRYNSMQEAAEDFVRRVIDSTDHFLSLGWRPGMTLSAAAFEEWEKTAIDQLARREIAKQRGQASGETFVAGIVWQRSVALFFRDLIVASQEKAKSWFLKIQELKTRVSPVRCGRTFLPLTVQSVQHLASKARRLEPDFSKLQVNVDLYNEMWWREFFSGTERILHHHDLWLQALEALPLRSCRIARSAVEEGEMGDSVRGPSSFVEAWFTTQALLALLGRPLSAVVSVRVYEYAQGLQILSRFERNEAVSRVMDRIALLAPGISETLKEVIRDHLYDLLKEMSQWDKRPTIDMQAKVFLDARYGEIIISPREALDYAIGNDVVLSMQIPRGTRNRAEMYKNIAEALPWEEVDAATMHAMIKEGAIPLVMIARGLARIPLERRGPCLDTFLSFIMVDKEILRTLIDDRTLTLTGNLVERFLDFLSANDLKNWIARLIPKNSKSLEDVRGQVHLVLKALMRLPLQDVHELLDNPRNRQWWAQEVFGELYDKQGFDHLDISLPVWRTFVLEVMGEDRWIRFMLTGTVLERETTTYVSLILKFADDYRAPWDRLHIPLMSELDWSFIFEKEGDDLAEIFRQYAEEDILAWAHADEPLEVFADRLRLFLDNRAGYYVRFGTTPPTPFDEE
ncbi:TPA: hypothetical protein DEP34_02345 [Candidatus Uhrbacteria bacterium]|uniref:Uncharacterized protein n=2 Tax=Candidatus Uhriibacteriota TaxID=1752732 RepID=A0A0G1Q818_9BACT|nr:MAG: hypothetical protein UX45_C0008G0025 [Candidatus Uhrbacteria bacterium GW2011_GWF2_46_218]KKU41129.1 MAG: hypothetical protein UX57_C0006G0039 [Candidatus Uhrbacteria bacterium GW2011_GWE2_46_68]HBK34310.1 hypothetical protein [Candidatus Uhrbacteria bacterium]HCB19203.1 hypothetical protein [Candidatus Uhrbacteria bacterium]